MGEDIGVTAKIAQLDAANRRAVTQLQEQTAQLAVEEIDLNGSNLVFKIQVNLLAGHEIPLGYPS
jgi:hypothetical protein